ncbi:Glu/Leu/Phe/Val family dehydrogenase [Sulfobacillus harzensis]|uniref:Glu/Leu/Phe/Val dehydrogenase n=1 Tax=Sulfobacillus harzensis TaxID=2729629 RepID=A0A7Y0L4M3_9FIRM|nr:Glu/Leu/Phe/Val dehydrogenase [Sulfobacillus harzensis]NMP23249.1 Glu/Leu/Phe/Val dehydrogenase [Sulfobacillus harzensis]
MDIFEEMERRGHEQVIFNYDRASGLKAIIAIHDTTLGPALGGCRMLPYASEEAALTDVLRLSEGMTYKAAAAGLDFGGGKTVIIGDPASDKSEALFRALGRFLETLHGRYRTGEDVGTSEEDFVHSWKETRYLVGLPTAYGGSGDTGDNTALGVMEAIHAALMHRFGSPLLKGRRVAIQGLGKVGYHVARRAVEEGAEVVAADINPHVVGRVSSQLGIEPTDPWAVLETECDVFAPCALGNVINQETVGRLHCQIIAGSANNQLENDSLATELMDRGILYAPDFITNAGGLIQVANEIQGYNPDRVRHQIEAIYDVLLAIFQEADQTGQSTTAVALAHVQSRLNTMHAIHRIHA